MSGVKGKERTVTITREGELFALREGSDTYNPKFNFNDEIKYVLDETKFPRPADIDYVKFYASKDAKNANEVFWTWTHSTIPQFGPDELPLEFRPTPESDERRSMIIANRYHNNRSGPKPRGVFFSFVINTDKREDEVYDPELQIIKEDP